MHQIAILAGRIGLHRLVKNPPTASPEALNDERQKHTQNHSTHTPQTDQSPQTKGNVLHRRRLTSDEKRQRSIFFN
ncbi:hypothetical protein [Pseudomonas syringae]|uniref:hypothetical protein n=1 Tax=Pseudomonas syringae TaxID=317 RepID=UPI0015C4AEA0|nr:hypothetical protein [Pseudomonas syringae]